MSAKQVQEAGGNVAQAYAYANDSEVANDLDAAKVAAMRAAELGKYCIITMKCEFYIFIEIF